MKDDNEKSNLSSRTTPKEATPLSRPKTLSKPAPKPRPKKVWINATDRPFEYRDSQNQLAKILPGGEVPEEFHNFEFLKKCRAIRQVTK